MISVEVIRWSIFFIQWYLYLGMAVAVVVALPLLQRVDPISTGGTIGFRLIIVPGLALLWPWTLCRVIVNSGQPNERNAHRLVACSVAPAGSEVKE